MGTGGRKSKKVSSVKSKYHTYNKMGTRVQRSKQKKKERGKRKKLLRRVDGKLQKQGVKPMVEEDLDVDDMMDMIDPELQMPTKSSNRNGNIEEEAAPYEKMGRSFADEEDMKQLLPIKTRKGAVVQREMKIDRGKEKEEPAEEVEQQEVEEKPILAPMSVAELMNQRQQKLQDRKIKIGSLAASFLEEPEQRANNLVSLVNCLDEADADIAVTVRKLTVLSLLEVFRDVLPDYRIVHHHSPGQKLKKTTKTLYAYESTLMDCYRIYLKKLEKFTHVLTKKQTNEEKKESLMGLAKLSVKCLCDLCAQYAYFNLGKNLISAVVSFMNHKDPEIGQMACQAIQKLFKEDKQQQMALVAVRYISQLSKKKNDEVRPRVLDTFLSLRLQVNLDLEKEEEMKAKKYLTFKEKKLHLSKRERKSEKVRENLERELEAAKAEVNKDKKYKFQTDIMKQIFAVYFRILKRNPNSRLMASVLEGLAKFAHLINVEFFGDLVNVFHELISGDKLKYRETLHCVQTVFAILSGQGESLNIDPLRFFTHAYKCVFEIHSGRSSVDLPILLRSLDTMLIRRRKKVSTARVLAFSKRLATALLQQNHAGAVAILALLKSVFMFHKSTELLLDPDAGIGSGHFLPELEDPEFCNAQSTCVWELHLASRSYNPDVSRMAKYLLQGQSENTENLPLDLSRKSCTSVWDDYDFSDMRFRPSIPPPPKTITFKRKYNEEVYLYSQVLQNDIEKTLQETPDTADFLLDT